MTTYTHTAEQHDQLLTIQKQLIDLGDEKTAALLDWAVTAEPTWINVRDRMPPDADEVLICVDHDDGNGPYVMVDRWSMHREDPLGMGGPTIEIGFDWDNNAPDDVTHWMPLPQPTAA